MTERQKLQTLLGRLQRVTTLPFAEAMGEVGRIQIALQNEVWPPVVPGPGDTSPPPPFPAGPAVLTYLNGALHNLSEGKILQAISAIRSILNILPAEGSGLKPVAQYDPKEWEEQQIRMLDAERRDPGASPWERGVL